MARVLLIEDDQEIAALLDRYLKRLGFLVHHCADGDAGVRAFEQGIFDVVITDGLLPKKTGFEVISAIRAHARGKDVGIVMISAAFRGPQSRREAGTVGADAFFAKPFVLTELKASVAELLTKYGRAPMPRPAPPAPAPTRPAPSTPAAPATPSTASPSTASPSTASPSTATPSTATPSGGDSARAAPASSTPQGMASAPRTPAPTAPAQPAPLPRTPTRGGAGVAGAAIGTSARGTSSPPPAAGEPGALPRSPTRGGAGVGSASGVVARVGSHEQVRAPEDVARLLLRCARQGYSGVLRFIDEQNQLQVALLRGVIVGANDNLREHLLGERLWKAGRLTTEQMRALNERMATKNERVAEALLALGFCEAGEALQYVEEQTLVRARRALSWRGAVLCRENEDEAHALATHTLDVAEVICSFALDAAQQPLANQLIVARALHRVTRHPRFEELLVPFARVAPQARLPGLLFSGQVGTLVDAVRGASAGELYAAWLVGLIALEGDAEPDVRALPDVLRVARAEGAVDKRAVEEVCATLLRARGRNYYEVVGVARDADSATALAALRAIQQRIGADTMREQQLGPAASAARELWHLLDEAEAVFTDDALRAAYDASLAPPAPRAPRPSGPEDAFLEGQQALAHGDAAQARACFERAAESRSADPDYVSYLGWAQVLTGDRDAGIARLMAALRAHPQAMRPVFFLGMVAMRDGDPARARALLEECARRSPDDVELKVALSALQ